MSGAHGGGSGRGTSPRPDVAWEVRHSVAFALSRHGEPEGVPPLEELSKDLDERVACYARQRLDWMNGIFRNRTEN